MCDYLLTSEVARALGRAPATIHYYERTGRLPAIRATGGVRLFHRNDVARLAAQLFGSNLGPARPSDRDEIPSKPSPELLGIAGELIDRRGHVGSGNSGHLFPEILARSAC